MVMRSRATEGRSASKCEGKWPDQLLTHRFRLSTLRQRFVPPPALPERWKTAKIRTGSAVHMGNPGQYQLLQRCNSNVTARKMPVAFLELSSQIVQH
jgi:hypothetical protein